MTWPQGWTVGRSLRLASSAEHMDAWKRAKDLEVLPFITQVSFEHVVVGQRKLPKAPAWLLSSLQCRTILKKKIQLLADLQGQTHLNLAVFFSRRMSWKFAHSLPPFLILLMADNLGNIFWRAEVTLLWLLLFFFHPAGLSLDVPFRVLSLSTPPKTERCSSFEFPENPRHILTETHTTSFAMAHLAAEFLMIPNQTPSRWRWALVQRRIHRAWHGAQHVVGVPSNQNVLWVGEVMTSVRFHNMWSNYNLESVPIPRCDFYFFLLSHLSISPMNKTKKKKKKKPQAKMHTDFSGPTQRQTLQFGANPFSK